MTIAQWAVVLVGTPLFIAAVLCSCHLGKGTQTIRPLYDLGGMRNAKRR